MAEGWHCQKCDTLVHGTTTRHHYRAVHQPTSFIRLSGSASKVRVDRDSSTGLFKCPRIGCSVSLELAQGIQDHARTCSKPLHYYPEEPSPEKRPNGSTFHASSASASRRYAGRYSNAGSTSASPTKDSPSSARTLRAHTAHLPQTTRTKRALVRHCYKGGDMMISEIAEFVGCDHRTVWSVVRNEDGDNLEEDKRYLSCEMGDIVDVDAIKHIRPFIKREPMDDDDSAFLRSDYATDDEEYDSEAEVEDLYIQASSDIPPRRRERRMSTGSDDSMLSSLTSLGDNDNDDSQVDAMSVDSPRTPDASNSLPYPEPSPGPSSTAYSNGTNASPVVPKIKTDDAMEAFIRSLAVPTEQFIQLFYEMEIDSAERVDWLCTQQEDYWADVKDYLLRNGVKLFHWLVIKKGLRDRAVALATNNRS